MVCDIWTTLNRVTEWNLQSFSQVISSRKPKYILKDILVNYNLPSEKSKRTV